MKDWSIINVEKVKRYLDEEAEDEMHEFQEEYDESIDPIVDSILKSCEMVNDDNEEVDMPLLISIIWSTIEDAVPYISSGLAQVMAENIGSRIYRDCMYC